MVLPAHPERCLGLLRQQRAGAVRLQGQGRQSGQGHRPRRPQRFLLRGRPQQRQAAERLPVRRQHHLGQPYRPENRPVENPGQRPAKPLPGETKGKSVEVSPPFLGGKNWSPMAYSQDTGLFYIPGNQWKEEYWTEEVNYKKGSAYLGMGFRIKRMYDDHVGTLRAMNPTTGKVVWEHKEALPLWAGVLATKGNLVFTGTGDGFFKAFDAKTGKELWKFQTGSGIVSPPITWEQDGEQYNGVTVGYGGAVPLWGGDMAELTKPVAQGGSFWVFKIPSWDNKTAQK